VPVSGSEIHLFNSSTESAITKDRFEYVQWHLGNYSTMSEKWRQGLLIYWKMTGTSFLAEMDAGPTRQIASRSKNI
jgi:hypothetical protein